MKTENLKIAIFPLGSAMKFSKEKIKRADGTSEYFKVFYGLVRNPNVSEVWIMQRSDWKKLNSDEKIAIDPRGVIRDIYTEFEVKLPPGRRQGPDGNLIPHTKEEQETYMDLWNKVKDIEQPDFGIGFASQGLTLVNIPGIIPSIKDPSRMTGALDMTLIYSAPLVHYLNMSNYFDTKLFLTTIEESENFISTSTSPIDLAAYYCNTNLVLVNDKQNKNVFVNQIQRIKNKNSISFEYGVDDINKLFNFIKWN